MNNEALLEKINNRFDTLEQGQKHLEQKIDTVDMKVEGVIKRGAAGFQEVNGKLDQALHDWADFFTEAGIFFDQMRNKIVARIERIEEHLGIPHKN